MGSSQPPLPSFCFTCSKKAAFFDLKSKGHTRSSYIRNPPIFVASFYFTICGEKSWEWRLGSQLVTGSLRSVYMCISICVSAVGIYRNARYAVVTSHHLAELCVCVQVPGTLECSLIQPLYSGNIIKVAQQSLTFHMRQHGYQLVVHTHMHTCILPCNWLLWLRQATHAHGRV